jgi:D-psicose/D-tagatose/L-ribulose 3-epimerase
MKFGMNLYVWTTNLTPAYFHLLPMSKGFGYDGVEVPVTPDNDNVYLEIKRCLDGEGLACTTITNVGADADPISPFATVRQKALD